MSAVRIDLRSDTVTTPDAAMRAAMASAEVGDDSYTEDPSVNTLESECARLFEKEAALFTSSGTMSNQLAVRSLTQPGDEVILDRGHHIHYFESAQTADLARVTLNACDADAGILTAEHLVRGISSKPRSPSYSRPALACVENSISCHGGRVFPLGALKALYETATQHGVSVYMDGARLLNACIASDTAPAAYARYTTALSLCFAKGLGAPFGAILVGPRPVIEKARRFRKWYGGALHQSGFLAAAALYALRNNRDRLERDHRNAKLFGELMASERRIAVYPVETNIVMFDVSHLPLAAPVLVDAARSRGLLLIAWTDTLVRAVMHRDVDEAEVRQAAAILLELCWEHGCRGAAHRRGPRRVEDATHARNHLR